MSWVGLTGTQGPVGEVVKSKGHYWIKCGDCKLNRIVPVGLSIEGRCGSCRSKAIANVWQWWDFEAKNVLLIWNEEEA